MILDKPIGVAGAGSIGCFVGGMYAAAGRRVALLARPRVIEEIEANGLRLTSFEGFEKRITPNQLTLSQDPQSSAIPAWCWSRSRAPIPLKSPTSSHNMRRPMP
jgi:hypothetical protein